ncbi:predicted protein, partial [Nematostella vectensis]
HHTYHIYHREVYQHSSITPTTSITGKCINTHLSHLPHLSQGLIRHTYHIYNRGVI